MVERVDIIGAFKLSAEGFFVRYDDYAKLEARFNTALIALRVLAAGGAAGKADRHYAAEVLEQCSESDRGENSGEVK